MRGRDLGGGDKQERRIYFMKMEYCLFSLKFAEGPWSSQTAEQLNTFFLKQKKKNQEKETISAPKSSLYEIQFLV